ncbi:MAG: sulfotransferase [Pirellulales bacterium]|nr:sulfotransferase [Pirellulales bacterium]
MMATTAEAKDRNNPYLLSIYDRFEAFRVPLGRHLVTQAASNFPRFWIRCGNWESRLLADAIQPVTVDRPIYVAGLARSGSTVLLETIASYPGVASHRYRDFPFVFTPIWWNRYLDRAPRKSSEFKPRVHADGLLVSSESPEALEEPLWMAFFRQAHDRGASQVLDSSVSRPDFEQFYRNHVRKVLAIRRGHRYACKGNYHVTRLEYLLKIFPDARFIIPIRRPRDHVASLMKQHRLFTEGETRYRRSLVQMQSCGHFEFGLDRRPIQCGNERAVAEVESLWCAGDEARGWARYWSQIYGFLAHRMAANAMLRQAAKIVWFEELCGRPQATLESIERHCDLPLDDALRTTLASRLHAPTYYRTHFTAAEKIAIEEETSEVVDQLSAQQVSKHPLQLAA